MSRKRLLWLGPEGFFSGLRYGSHMPSDVIQGEAPVCLVSKPFPGTKLFSGARLVYGFSLYFFSLSTRVSATAIKWCLATRASMTFPLFLVAWPNYCSLSRGSLSFVTQELIPAVTMSFVWPETWADPRPGSYAFLCVPSLSYFQWHPFSIATFSNENRLAQLIIKPTGANEWTGRLASLAVDGDVAVPVWIDGPYGSLPDLSKFKVILLCAGGVGVTPMISLLQWLARAASSHNHTDGSFCLKNIVFLWTARDLETVSNLWFGEVFQSNELRDLRRVCDVSFVFHNTSLPSSALNGKKRGRGRRGAVCYHIIYLKLVDDDVFYDSNSVVIAIVIVVVFVNSSFAVVDLSTFFGPWAHNYSVGPRIWTSRLEPLLLFD